jgi:hypothetical protein
MDLVTSPVADAMVTNVLHYVTVETPPLKFMSSLEANYWTTMQQRRSELNHLRRWLILRRSHKVRECRTA